MSRILSSMTCLLAIVLAADVGRRAAAQEASESQFDQPPEAADTEEDDQARSPDVNDEGEEIRRQSSQSRQNRSQQQQDPFEGERRFDERQGARTNQPSDRRQEGQLDRRFEQGSDPRFDRQFDQGFEQPLDRGRREAGERSSQFQRQPRQGFDLGAEFSATIDPQSGLNVSSVNEGTLAAQIGLQENDEIVSVGGRQVSSADELNQILMRSQSGEQRIPIVVRRNGSRSTLFVQPQMVRGTLALPPGAEELGVVFAPAANDQLVVREVTGGLADVIGLRANDVILSVAGRQVLSGNQFERILYTTDLDTVPRVPVIVMRDGRRVVLYLERDAWQDRPYAPDREYYAGANAWLGVTLDTRYQDAAVVRDVVPDSPADFAGVRRGDWIVQMNGRRIGSSTDLTRVIDTMNPGQEVEIEVVRRVRNTLVAQLEGQPDYQPRQAARPTYDAYEPRPSIPYEEPSRFVPRQPVYGPGVVVEPFQTDQNRGVLNRLGPGERGLRDRLDRDELPEP